MTRYIILLLLFHGLNRIDILALNSSSIIKDFDSWTYMSTSEKLNGIIMSLNQDVFFQKLSRAPKIGSVKKSNVTLSFPTADGRSEVFEIFYTPVMPKNLRDRYSTIKTYTGIGLYDPNTRVSVTISHMGMKAMVLGKEKNTFIDPSDSVLGFYRVSYVEIGSQSFNQSSGCGDQDIIIRAQFERNREDFPDCVGEDVPCYSIGDTLVTYRFAGIITAEANNEIADGTVAGGMAWLNAIINQVNLLWVRELSFRLELIENNDELIYTDNNPTPSDFTAFDMYTELPLVLDHITNVIGSGGYATPAESLLWEYGAVFNTGYGGGLAYVPGSTSANLPTYEIFNHEIGHNLGSLHNCSTEGGWKSTIGGSIMCWRSTTLPGNTGDQYTSHTIDIAIKYQQEKFSSSGYDYQRGWTRSFTGNIPPAVNVPESGFTIPMQTPFELSGSASSSDSTDNLTYSWEQNDVSEESFESPMFPDASGPLFCSVDGSANGSTRFFPAMVSLLENHYETLLDPSDDYVIEKLPFADREINMRLLVRDNDLYSGSYNYANVQFFVTDHAGPFRVTSQQEDINWETGTSVTITWDVANTDNPSGVDCQNVDIILSIDGGNTFDIVLVQSTPNDGSELVTVPNVPSNNVSRIMVKSSDNIFFDINNTFFTINNSAEPILSIDTTSIMIELPTDTVVILESEIFNNGEEGSVLTYDIAVDQHSEGDGFLSFDGVDDNVDLGANLLSGVGDFSLSLWVKTSATDQVFIQQRNGGFNGEYQLRINGNGRANFWTYRDGYKWSVTSTENINDDVWRHIVIVQSTDINGGRIYIDGTENQSNNNGLVNLDGAIHTYLGADMRDLVDYYQGWINDVGIFNGKLTDDDVAILYEAGPGFNMTYDHDGYSGSEYLVAFYPMKSMEGTILEDGSGNDHNGVISGASWEGDLYYVPDWLTVDGYINWLSSGESDPFNIMISTSELSVNTTYHASVIIVSNDHTAILPVNLAVNNNLSVVSPIVISEYRLHDAYPNPFNPITTLRYDLKEDSFVTLEIYDVIGRNIKSLINSHQAAGNRSINWDATNNFGESVSAGMYIYTIQAGEFRQTKKMVVLK